MTRICTHGSSCRQMEIRNRLHIAIIVFVRENVVSLSNDRDFLVDIQAGNPFHRHLEQVLLYVKTYDEQQSVQQRFQRVYDTKYAGACQ
jgi:hypothetical protein